MADRWLKFKLNDNYWLLNLLFIYIHICIYYKLEAIIYEFKIVLGFISTKHLENCYNVGNTEPIKTWIKLNTRLQVIGIQLSRGF